MRYFRFTLATVDQQGFTLIELLVVIVLLGILSTLGMVNYLNARLRARDVQRKANLTQIQSALELYRQDQGSYPTSLPGCGMALQDPGQSTTYLKQIPCDPTNKTPFVYTYAVDSSGYSLRACLENTNDPQKDTPANGTPCSGTSEVSYTVTNQ